MDTNPRRGDAPAIRPSAALALIALGSLLGANASAGLGERAESVQRDHVALHGTRLAVTPATTYDVHETTTADGTNVRQYVSRAGTVFAVAWSGPKLPDLRVVLAGHYDQYLAATRVPHASHKVLTVTTADAVISVVRHPRGFTGGAYAPALLPPDVAVQDLR